jgi:hypothetical protein
MCVAGLPLSLQGSRLPSVFSRIALTDPGPPPCMPDEDPIVSRWDDKHDHPIKFPSAEAWVCSGDRARRLSAFSVWRRGARERPVNPVRKLSLERCDLDAKGWFRPRSVVHVRIRSRIASCAASGTQTAVSSPPRYRTARLAASRLSFFYRSPLLRGKTAKRGQKEAPPPKQDMVGYLPCVEFGRSRG